MSYSKHTNKILSAMYNHETVKKSCFSVKKLHLLYADGIIENSSDFHDDNVYLTDKGEAYVEEMLENIEEKRSNKIHRWINSVVAVLSLILAVISLLLQTVF